MTKRNLYLDNTPPQQALEQYLVALGGHLSARTEEIEVIAALDRVTADCIFARKSSPLSDCAAMDGIAVISARTIGAGERTPVTLEADVDYIIVDTGDPVRQPFDAVIMAEDIQQNEDGAVTVRHAAAPWQHVRPIGEDIVEGEMILTSAHRIRPIDIGVLLSGGIQTVTVTAEPRVAIIPTGTELVEPGADLKSGDIIESNSRMFEGMVTKCGGRPIRCSPLTDDYEVIKQAVRKASEECDMVLINAGSSAGTEDYTVHVLREIGQVVVHGVSMKPGKPTILAIVNGKPVVGLPGYPVSAFLAFQNFAAPVLCKLSGQELFSGERIRAVISRKIVSSLKYQEFVRVRVGQVGERLVASPLARGAGSSMSLVRADGFCVIEQDSEGVVEGEEVEVILNGTMAGLAKTLVSIGSHDLILDLIADMLPAHTGYHLTSTHVGSAGGLMALRRGEAHIAPTHLLDEITGEYNIPVIKEMFKDRPMALIKGVGREQGIIVQKGNPLGVKGVEDLTRVRYVNRQRGAGTRALLDNKLKYKGIDTNEIEGYEREAATHMAVAAAVQGGSADAGMGILSAARTSGLDFIPVGQEEYDFAIPCEFLSLPAIEAFIQVLGSKEFKNRIDLLGGYTSTDCARVIMID